MTKVAYDRTHRIAGLALDSWSADRLLPARRATSWGDHQARLGPLPDVDPGRLAGEAAAVGLTGRGGAAFPTACKLSAVAAAVGRSGLPAVVVANCCEGDPTSLKDRVLVSRSPHLIVDGAVGAAVAVGADRVLLAVHENSASGAAFEVALSERPPSAITVRVVGVPGRYIASEATALVRYLNAGDARPTGRSTPVWNVGIGGRPTLVDNAETLAQLALLARFGAEWFAGPGARSEPGTVLVTVGGAVPAPGVLEVPQGTPVGAILGRAGAGPVGWALIGGLAGRWTDLASVAGTGWDAASLAGVGLTKGVGSIIVLPPGGCPVTETQRILRHQANAGAGQCGPCMFGLPAIADDFTALVLGERAAIDRLRRRLPVISGRGACSHPDGAVVLAASALTAMDRAGHLGEHLRQGGCAAPPPVVPLGGATLQPGRSGVLNRRTS